MRTIIGVLCFFAAVQSAVAGEAFISQPNAHSFLLAPEALLSAGHSSHANLAVPLALAAIAPTSAAVDPRVNASYISQAGTNNFAAVVQSGGGNLSLIVQRGAGNQAIVTQTRGR
ncbi:MAG: hypothetical protein NTAFB05_21770 [Nitrobacter sp.]|uniref:hypothetical protein n=1 Tax=Nitrobacter sp. TaxID=29420 RepID=UPI00387DF680